MCGGTHTTFLLCFRETDSFLWWDPRCGGVWYEPRVWYMTEWTILFQYSFVKVQFCFKRGNNLIRENGIDFLFSKRHLLVFFSPWIDAEEVVKLVYQLRVPDCGWIQLFADEIHYVHLKTCKPQYQTCKPNYEPYQAIFILIWWWMVHMSLWTKSHSHMSFHQISFSYEST